MKTTFAILLLLTLFSFKRKTITEDLRSLFVTSDSILILSHIDTGSVYEDSLGNEIEAPQILIQGKLNRAIVIEEKAISNLDRKKLFKILDRPIKKMAGMAGCFEPHHAILLFKNNEVHYIDICFKCGRIKTSGELQLNEAKFDEQKWDELESFFKKNGLNHEFK